jgi:hypothetical protein
MLNKKIFIFIIFNYTLSNVFAQYYIQPQIGFINIVSKRIGNPPNFIKKHTDFQIYTGLLIGKKNNKIEQQLGYFFYPIGIAGGIEKPYAAWGSKYMVTHNISYSLNYSFLSWKRIDLRVGSFLHLCTSRLTWPSAYSVSKGVIGYQDAKVEETDATMAYERTQLTIEPYLDLNVRLFKRIIWNLHKGYNFGFKNMYTMDSEYTISGVPQPKGSSETKGSGGILTTGFKFYFKNQTPTK